MKWRSASPVAQVGVNVVVEVDGVQGLVVVPILVPDLAVPVDADVTVRGSVHPVAPHEDVTVLEVGIGVPIETVGRHLLPCASAGLVVNSVPPCPVLHSVHLDQEARDEADALSRVGSAVICQFVALVMVQEIAGVVELGRGG